MGDGSQLKTRRPNELDLQRPLLWHWYMGWYVSHLGKVLGPVGYEQIQKDIESGVVTTDMWVRDDSGGQWMPIVSSPFAPLLIPPPRPNKLGELRRGETERLFLRIVARGVAAGGMRLLLILFLIGLALSVVWIFIRAASV